MGRERQRKARLAEKLDDLHRCRAAAAVRIRVLPIVAAALPEGVGFETGRLIVEFGGMDELLSRLYALSQAAASDYEAFRRIAEQYRSKP